MGGQCREVWMVSQKPRDGLHVGNDGVVIMVGNNARESH